MNVITSPAINQNQDEIPRRPQKSKVFDAHTARSIISPFELLTIDKTRSRISPASN